MSRGRSCTCCRCCSMCRSIPWAGSKGIHPIDEQHPGNVQTVGIDRVSHVGIAQRGTACSRGCCLAMIMRMVVVVGVGGGGGAGQALEVAEVRGDGRGRRSEGQPDGLAAAEAHFWWWLVEKVRSGCVALGRVATILKYTQDLTPSTLTREK